ncbi:uncharacterized protein LOC130724847 [Lotus japonicus]|uniref:uncharacterized protein LOC130724847 n=2 Tax=Lotus japonicus TaxID=34305 RepID=UPI00258CDEFA|nr:uncharacterized protein LOC130724847 [Lotus japonicus]
MRLLNTNGHQDNDDVKEFAEWILKLGNGESTTNDDGEMLIDVPHDLLITDPSEPLLQLIQFVYPDMVSHLTDPIFYQERAILAPTLESVEKVNQYILSCIEGEEKEYLSCDSACKFDEDNDVEAAWLTPEFLHEVKCSGIPNHKLVLKDGVSVMLLRNLDQSSGLCNGTRLLIEDLCPNVTGATVVTGTNSGKKVYIGRMS